MRLLHNPSRPLPVEVRRALRRNADRLTARLPGLDEEVGIWYPPVEVPCVAWKAQDADGNLIGMPFARSLPRQVQGVYRLIVEISPAALLAFSESELVEGVLAHEFLHYAWTTIDFYKRAEGLVAPDAPGPHAGEYMANYEANDKVLQVPAADWISERLASLVNRVETSESAEMRDVQQAMVDLWVMKGLPTEYVDLEYVVDGRFGWDISVIKKARTLGLL